MKVYGDFSILQLFKSSFGIDIETPGVRRIDWCYTIAFSNERGGVVFELRNRKERRAVRKILKKTLCNKKFRHYIIFHNLQFDLGFLLREFFPGIKFKRIGLAINIVDTIVLGRFIDSTKPGAHIDSHGESSYSLKFMLREYQIDDGHKSFSKTTAGIYIELLDQDKLCIYNHKDAQNTYLLYLKLRKVIEERNGWNFVEEVLLPHAIWNMFHLVYNGVPINRSAISTYLEDFYIQLETVSKRVYRALGKKFNIGSGDEIASAIFYNKNLLQKGKDELTSLEDTMYVYERTNKGHIKTDVSSLKEVRKLVNKPNVVDDLIQTLELRNAISSLEVLNCHSVYLFDEDNWGNIFSHQSASAKSGRVRCTRPALHGIGKQVFTDTLGVDSNDKGFFNKRALSGKNYRGMSVREVISVPEGYSVVSIDASALDLVALAHLADIQSWKEIFKDGVVDFHMEILRLGNPDFFGKIFEPLEDALMLLSKRYKVMKVEKSKLRLISSDRKIKYINLTAGQEKEYKNNRSIVKETNLGIPYLMGAYSLSQKIREATDAPFSPSKAQELLDSYHRNFPEIRKHQDLFAQHLYDRGFKIPVLPGQGENFGMRISSCTWSDLNICHHDVDDNFQFVIKVGANHWFVEVNKWDKYPWQFQKDRRITSNMELVEKSFGLYFKQFIKLVQLPDWIFALKNESELNKGSFKRRTEDIAEELSNYKLNSVQRSNEIDKFLNEGYTFTEKAEKLLCSFLKKGRLRIPENNILFYRTSARFGYYFRPYKSFLKEVKKLFPTYSQSGANTLMAKALIIVREMIESSNLLSYIFLFVQDSIDCVAPEKEVKKLKSILKAAFQNTFVPLAGEPDEKVDKFYQ